MVNKRFWDCVKKIVSANNVDMKPCHYYAKNKNDVQKEYVKEIEKKKKCKNQKQIIVFKIFKKKLKI